MSSTYEKINEKTRYALCVNPRITNEELRIQKVKGYIPADL